MDYILDMKLTVLTWCLTKGLKILIILFVVSVINKFSKKILSNFIHPNVGLHDEQTKRQQTIYYVINSAITIITFTIAALLILELLGINIGPILAAAGVVGIAIGFGSQRLVEDITSGIIMLINNQVRVGDVVKIDQKTGYIEKLTLNMVVLRDFDGSVHFIRNGRIDVISNLTKEYSFFLTEIGVDYSTDIEKATNIIKSVVEQMQKEDAFKDDILAPVEVWGIDKFADSAIMLKLRIKTKPIKQWYIGREFNFRIKKAFDENGIEFPYNQIVVHKK